MPPREAQVHAAVPADAEQPQRVQRHSELRVVGLVFAAPVQLVGAAWRELEGRRRHGSAPLCGALPVISGLLDRLPPHVRPLLDGRFLGWLGHGLGRLRSE